MMKRLISKNKIIFKRKYSITASTEPFNGKYTQEQKESPNAKKLKTQGKKNETKYLGTTTMEKILTNDLGKKELDSVNFKDPETLKRWIAETAVKGPEFQFVRGPDEEQLKPVVVTVTGAAGNIAYSLLPRIAAGDMLGENQPIILKLIEMPQAMGALEGTVMELQDCAFPLLKKIVATSDLKEGFTDADFCLLVGSKPRTKGMERSDLLKENAKSFAQQGRAINHYADPNVLTLVVGNPANTNALVASKNSPNLNPNQYSAMTRLDHDRALAQITEKVNCKISDIERFCIWGNHSATQFPDLSNTLIKGKWALDVINDPKWISDTFIPTVQQRGAAIIEARSKSSAASAANAAIAHMRDWVLGSAGWTSKAIYSTGQNGVESEIYSSFPVLCHGAGQVDVVGNIPFSEESAQRINASVKELLEEKEAVKNLFPPVFRRLSEIPSDEVYSWKWLSDTIPKQHIDALMKDSEYIDAVKSELVNLVPLREGLPKDLTVAWKGFDWAKLGEDVKNSPFESLSKLQKSKNLTTDDIQRLNLVALKSLENDADLIERKYKKVYYDIEDFTFDERSFYLDMSEEDKIKFHNERVCEDGKLSESGINTKAIVSNLITHIVKSKPKFYFE